MVHSEQPELGVGLQEWAVICRALRAGALHCVVRKGGIHEPHGGAFTVQQPRFLLLPTYLHQDPSRLHPTWRSGCRASRSDPDPDAFVVDTWAAVGGVWKVTRPDVLTALADRVPWTAEELLRRYRYRGDPWLAVLALRVHALPQPVRLPFLPAYRGCRSWISLAEPVPLTGSTPVLDDDAWATRLDELSDHLGTSGETPA